jgi:osmoprotectant transport system permease protein
VFIFRGLASVDTTLLLAGAVPAALMALLADGGLGWVERKLSPA